MKTLTPDTPIIGAVYLHYKKQDPYRVMMISKHSETGEWMVVYCPIYPCEVASFVRPLSMWSELVEYNGARVPRFSPTPARS